MDPAARLDAARDAVALVLADWEQQGSSSPVVQVGLSPDGNVDIRVNGDGTFPSASGEDRAALVVSVADYLQAELMELEAPHRVWPTCPQHPFGLHARLAERVPACCCLTGGHVVAAIGSLERAQTLGVQSIWRFCIVRLFDDYSHDLDRDGAQTASHRLDEEPAPTNSRKVDAALAALAEFLARRGGWIPPVWALTAEVQFVLEGIAQALSQWQEARQGPSMVGA